MGRVLAPQQVWAITGKLEVKFRKPVPLDQELTVVGELVGSQLVKGIRGAGRNPTA